MIRIPKYPRTSLNYFPHRRYYGSFKMSILSGLVHGALTFMILSLMIGWYGFIFGMWFLAVMVVVLINVCHSIYRAGCAYRERKYSR